MNPKETVPVLVKLAPVLAAAGPPALIGVAIGLGLLWLLSDEKKQETPPTLNPSSECLPTITNEKIPPIPEVALASPPAVRNKRICREDLAEVLLYGARVVPRGEAVSALQTLGFKKTAAYKALSNTGRFRELIEVHKDGQILWRG